MDQTAGIPKPSWTGLVLAMAILAGSCIAALVLDDSFQPEASHNAGQVD